MKEDMKRRQEAYMHLYVDFIFGFNSHSVDEGILPEYK